MIDIANGFVNKGVTCALIAGRLVVRDKPLDARVGFAKIIRYDRRTALRRLFTWTLAFLQIWVLVVFRYRGSRLLIVSNPPVAPLLPLFCGNRFSLLIYDVWPDALSQFGVLSARSWLVRLWRYGNRRVYRRADRIYTITEGMKDALKPYAGHRAVEVVPVWTDNTSLSPIPRADNPFISRHGLQDKFVVMYSGNLGFSHNVEVIVNLAAQVDDPDIVFLIIGDGDKRKLIQDRITALGLKNCKMLPFQPFKELSFSLSAADIAIVTLGREAARLGIPSKSYNLMSVGAPLLCIADPESDLSRLVADLNIGESFSADQLKEMGTFIHDLKRSPERADALRKNALAASLRFSPENARRLLHSGRSQIAHRNHHAEGALRMQTNTPKDLKTRAEKG